MKKGIKYILGISLLLMISLILINQFTGISNSVLRSEKSEIENRLISKDSFICILKSKKDIYSLGEKPELSIKIINKTDSTVLLAGSLDGSDLGRRPPHCLFYVNHQIFGNVSEVPGICGNLNTFREQDLVKVKPDSSFNPYKHIDNQGFFSSYQIQSEQFWIPGEYKIKFFYSTKKEENSFKTHKRLLQIDSSLKDWYFEEGKEAQYFQELKYLNKLDSLWNLIPQIEIESNVITIKYKI